MSRNFGSSSSNTSSRMSSVAPGTEWEDLRKQARQHENEIETKLSSFSKLCSNYLAHEQSIHLNNDLSSNGSNSSTSSTENMSMEIEKLLERLSDINQRMADVVPASMGPNPAATHTLQRHHDILQDYRREFERTRTNIRNFKKREDLMSKSSSSTNNSSDVTIQGLSSRRQDYYLREMGHLNNSHKLIDNSLEMASMIKKDLSDQRRLFLNITTKVNAVANRFPLVNNLLQKIKVKKRKDSLVLGLVIAICFIILLLYMFR